MTISFTYDSGHKSLPGMYVFHYYLVSLSKSCLWSVCILYIFKSLFFIVLHQHPLMVQSSFSSKSNRSQSKSTHTAFKVGPPGKKNNAVLMDKAKKNKQQSIKKYMCTGNYFICWVVAHLTLKLLLIRWKCKTSQEWSEHRKFASSVKKTER